MNPAVVAKHGDNLFAVGVRLTLSRDTAQAPTSTLDVRAALQAREPAGSTPTEEGRVAGVWVEFPRDEAAYFTFPPLSTGLMSGSAQVTELDPATLTPARESTVTLSSVELDTCGQAFLAAVDGLLAPQMAAAIERLDKTAYA